MYIVALCLFFWGSLLPLFSQEQTTYIAVRDTESGRSLAGVRIYGKVHGKTRGVLTDRFGIAKASMFYNTDSLVIEKSGYKTQTIAVREVLQADTTYIVLQQSYFRADEAVVSAGRWEESQKDVPYQVSRATVKDIEFSQAPTPADILTATGEVFVQKSQMGGGSPMLRGFAANSILLVIDGVRMNNAIYRSGNLQNIISADANFLESMDIIFGPGSALFGSDALGGVINLTTKKTLFATDSAPVFSGHAMGRVASASREGSLHADILVGWKNVSLFTSVSFSRFGDLRVGANRLAAYPDDGKSFFYVARIDGQDFALFNPDENIQRPSGYSQYNILQKIAWKPSDNLTLEYAFHLTSSSDIPRYDRLIELRNNLPRDAEWYYGPQYWQMNVLTLSVGESFLGDSSKIILSQQTVEESRHTRRFASNRKNSQVEDVSVWALNIDAKRDIAGGELYYGLEVLHNSVNSASEDVNILTFERSVAQSRYPDGGNTVFSSALYAQYVTHITDKLSLSAAARGVLYNLRSSVTDTVQYSFLRDDITVSHGALTGSVGIVYNLSESTRINANLATGFRSPNIDDIAKVFDSAPGEVVVPNPSLTPEYTLGAELGLQQRLFNDKLALQVTGYYTRLTDAIERRPFLFRGQDSIEFEGVLSRVTANQNIGEAWIAGLSVSLQAELMQYLTLQSSVTYTDGRDIRSDIPLRHVPPLFGQAAIQYQTGKFQFQPVAQWNGWKHFADLSPDEQAKTHIYTPDGTPAWIVFHVRSRYSVTETWELQFSLENMFDRYYRPFSSGIGAPGRNIVLGLRAKI